LNTEAAWNRMLMKVIWGDMIDRFLDGPEKHTAWLRENCFATLEAERAPARAAAG
jgi:hypothetical protein